jgi:lipopolysaccharide heptosyltransferase I
MSAPTGPLHVAIVKLSSLGDVIHALPVARRLRAARPEWRLSWVVEAPKAEFLRGQPGLDAVITVDTRRWRRLVTTARGVLEAAREIAAVRRQLARARIDVALDLQGLLKSGLLAAATRAPRRIGFAASRCREPISALFTTCRVTPPPAARHIVEQYCALLAPLGLPAARPEVEITVDASADRRAQELLAAAGVKRGDRLVILNPGAGRAAKQWPLAHFRQLANQLWGSAGARVLVTWGPGEEVSARLLAGGLVSKPIVAPPTDIPTLAALLRHAAVVVGGDTGPIHLAAGLGTPTVGLYGPTRAERNGPFGPRATALQSPDGTMAAITPAAVFDAVVEYLP